MKSFYEILGIPSTADTQEIKSAYKKLATRHHPDKHTGPEKKYQEEIFKRISEAYNILKNPESRKKYDLKLYYSRNPANFQRQKPSPSPRPAYRKRKSRADIIREKKTERKAYLFTGAAMIALVVAVLFFYNFMNRFTADKRLEQGKEFEASHRLLDAYIHYQEAIDKNPDLSEAYMRLGDLELKMKNDKNRAAALYSKALETTKSHLPEIYIKAFKVQRMLRNDMKALNILNEGILKNPDNDSLYFYRGDQYSTFFEENKKALLDFDKAIRISPDFYDAKLGKAITLQNMGSFQNSTDLLNTLAFQKPEEGSVYYIRAFNNLHLGDTLAACNDWDHAALLNYKFAIKKFRDRFCEQLNK